MKPNTIIAGILLVFLVVTSASAGPCTIEIATLSKTLAAKDAGSGPTPGAQTPSQRAPNPSDQHPPNSIMREQTEGKATSSEDVRRQNAGLPTLAQPGGAATNTVTADTVGAGNALNRAQLLDRQGKETECMEAIKEAKQMAGPR